MKKKTGKKQKAKKGNFKHLGIIGPTAKNQLNLEKAEKLAREKGTRIVERRIEVKDKNGNPAGFTIKHEEEFLVTPDKILRELQSQNKK
jgi:hypothetical protein